MENEKPQTAIKFASIKEEIEGKSEELAKKAEINEPITLIDGFAKQPFSKTLSTSFIVGGPVIPMVMFLGKKSGRIYFFALKAICDVNI